MFKLSPLLLAAFVFCTSGCEFLDQAQKSTPEKAQASPKEIKPVVRRFVLSKFAGDVAFDTRTGQTCRTWDWSPLTPGKTDAKTGISPQVKFGEFSPTCSSL